MFKSLRKFSPDAGIRRQEKIRKVSRFCRKNNLLLYQPNLIWFNDKEFNAAEKDWGKIPGLPRDRRFFIFSTARSLRKVKGDTADIGVRYGTSSYFILRGFNDLSRQHYLFDSFEGVSAPTAEDGGNQSTWSKGDLAVDESVTRANLKNFPNCNYHKGWIPKRFPDVADRKFALVHIDVDLHAPTLQSLEFFYERTVPGGIIICDDYGFSNCDGAKKAFDDFFADKPESVTAIPSGQCIVVKK